MRSNLHSENNQFLSLSISELKLFISVLFPLHLLPCMPYFIFHLNSFQLPQSLFPEEHEIFFNISFRLGSFTLSVRRLIINTNNYVLPRFQACNVIWLSLRTTEETPERSDNAKLFGEYVVYYSSRLSPALLLL